MLKLRYTRRTYYVAPEDDHAIATIMECYGLSTQSDAVRLALRILATSPVRLTARKKKVETRP